MDAIYCTCNRTAPLNERGLAKLLGNGSTVRVFDALCRGGCEALRRMPVSPDGVFLGCGREAQALKPHLEEAGHFAHSVIAWDVARWVRGLAPAQAARRAAAYAQAARVLLEATEPIPTWTVEVGPRVLVAGPASATLARALAAQLEVIWVGEDEPPDGVRALPGRVVSVEGSLGAFTAEVATGSPVDPDTCVDCGACREACRRGALDRWYRLDPERCDGCRECEEVCSRVGALDLGARRRRVLADQVVWAGGSVPPRPGLYTPESREEWAQACAEVLALAWDGQVEAFRTVRFEPALCSHRHAGQTGCTRCVEACPSRALVADAHGVAIREELCSGCGNCVGTCPTGALDSLPWGSAVLGEALRAFVSNLEEGASVALVCADCDEPGSLPEAHAVFPLPSLSLLDASHVLGALAAGASHLAVSPCGRCSGPAQGAFHVAAQALDRTGQGDRLSWSANEVRPSGSGKARASIAWPTEALPAEKRPILAGYLEALVRASDRAYPPLEGPFGNPRVDEGQCTGCGACVGACRTGALGSQASPMALVCTEALCTACGLCVSVCPEGAIRVDRGLRWCPEAFEGREVVRDEGWACPRCGKVFGTGRAVESVIARLAARLPQADTDLVRLCPDCRTISAFFET